MASNDNNGVRNELLEASDAQIDDAVRFADPMVLRGLLYQHTADPELSAIEVKRVMAGYVETVAPVREEDVALLQRKAADFLKAYRDAGAGPLPAGPEDRLPASLGLLYGGTLTADEVGIYTEDLALDRWARGLKWKSTPDPERLRNFTVAVIGAGMAGLNAALQLKRAGIPFSIIEKNPDIGGTWYENRYPGARLDTPSWGYTNVFGADFGFPYPFSPWTENRRYVEWMADSFDLRPAITFDTEVTSMRWDESAAFWEIHLTGPGGEEVRRANAVITAVGIHNRPGIPEFEGSDTFEGQSWHTARWPEGVDLKDKRFAVIGTGCTGYQLIPELALEAGHVTVFQRTPQWIFPIKGYRSPFPPQVTWLDRNLPLHTNFMRAKAVNNAWFTRMSTIDPDFDDPYACSASNKIARDASIAYLEQTLQDPELVKNMTPPHPVWSARGVLVDIDYNILHALLKDHVTLQTSGIRRFNRTGIEAQDGTQHDVDVIVYATGFRANEFLYPMKVTGRDGITLDEMWKEGGARAYMGTMVPGFPNLWSLYGPNTNGGLQVPSMHDVTIRYALECIEGLILEGARAIEPKEDAYWRFSRMIDEENNRRVWSDPRANNYYWSKHGRSATMNPLSGPQTWRLFRHPEFAEMDMR